MFIIRTRMTLKQKKYKMRVMGCSFPFYSDKYNNCIQPHEFSHHLSFSGWHTQILDMHCHGHIIAVQSLSFNLKWSFQTLRPITTHQMNHGATCPCETDWNEDRSFWVKNIFTTYLWIKCNCFLPYFPRSGTWKLEISGMDNWVH